MAAALLVYCLALVVTLLMIGLLPPALVSLMLEHRRTRANGRQIRIAVSLAAAYLLGGVVGWALRPAQWTMPFVQTFEAAFNAAKYGHAVESQAERVLMYPWYMAVLFTIVVSLAALAARSFRHRSRSAAAQPSGA